MKKFEFYNDLEVICGEGALKMLPREFAKTGAKKAMLISGPILTKIGAVKKVTDAFEGTNVEIKVLFNAVPNESSLEVISEIARIYKANDCDCLIAAGGGSVIDTAKGVRIVVANGESDLTKFMGLESVPVSQIRTPFAVIPTTAGTGSEATKVAVISDLERQLKLEFISGTTLPNYAVLDPVMTQSLPQRATYTTGMDALTHAVEAYVGTQKHALTDEFAITSIKMIREHLENSVNNPDDLKEREGMLEASLFAGIAFSNSMVGIVHAIGHALGGGNDISHDRAMALLLPACIEFNSDVVGERYAELLLYFAGEEIFKATPKEQRAQRLADYVRELNKKYFTLFNIPQTLREIGMTESDVDLVVKNALRDGAILANIKQPTHEEVRAILMSIY